MALIVLVLLYLFSITSATNVDNSKPSKVKNTPLPFFPPIPQLPVPSPQSMSSDELTVIPTDSHSFLDYNLKSRRTAPSPAPNLNPKSSKQTVIPVDSQMFFSSDPKPPRLDAFSTSEPKPQPPHIPIDSQVFLNSEPRPNPPQIPIDSQVFFTSEPKPPRLDTFATTVQHQKQSDRTAVTIDSQMFFSNDPKPPRLDAFSATVMRPKAYDLTDIQIDSQTFFTNEPKPPRFDTISKHQKQSESERTAIPIDSQMFFRNNPKPPHLDAVSTSVMRPKAYDFPIDSQTFFTSEPKPPRLEAFATTVQHPKLKSEPKSPGKSVSYCSVYFRKDELKTGTILCPIFAPPSHIEKSRMKIICQEKSTTEKEQLKFCSSSYQDIRQRVTMKLGKINLFTSDKTNLNSSTIDHVKKISTYGKAVVCHRAQNMAFYCHQISKSSVYALSLRALHPNGGQKSAKMLAVCHDDTTSWSPNKIAFKLLNVKPGVGICHVLPSYDLVWVSQA